MSEKAFCLWGFGALCEVQWSSDRTWEKCALVRVCVWMSECVMESHEEKHPTFQRGVAFVEWCQNLAIFAV